MNNELKNMYSPNKLRIMWTVFYSLVVVIVVSVFWLAAAQVRSHSLPVGTVELSVPYSKYLVGETVSFTVKNNYNSEIYVINRCPDEPLAVYRLINEKWVRQHDDAPVDECPDRQRQIVVPAGESVSGSFSDWKNLFSEPGKYRIVALVEYESELPYQDIEIIAKPAETPKPSSTQTTTTQPSTTTNNSGTTTSTSTQTHEPDEPDEPDELDEPDDN